MSAGRRPVLAVTVGDPAGIGPDICLSLRAREFSADIVLLGDVDVLAARARVLGLDPPEAGYPASSATPGRMRVLHVPVVHPVVPGRLDPRNADHVLALLDRALSGCRSGEFAGMVTAPVNKAVLNDAGHGFSGHTEYLAERSGCPLPVMMLVGGRMRVALVTTHLPLSEVPKAITRERVRETLRVLSGGLARHFGLARPRILVAGLNPHAGDGGHIGREDVEQVAPAILDARDEGMLAEGPLPADTLFHPRMLEGVDAVLAMYHDQGLPVLKHASFGQGVNVTLGLPFIRTSVDHGTAAELAASGRADPGSLIAAVELALAMAARRVGQQP